METFDRDKNKYITFDELRSKLAERGYSPHEIEEVFLSYDLDENVKLDVDEIHRLINDVEKVRKSYRKKSKKTDHVEESIEIVRKNLKEFLTENTVSLAEYEQMTRRIAKITDDLNRMMNKMPGSSFCGRTLMVTNFPIPFDTQRLSEFLETKFNAQRLCTFDCRSRLRRTIFIEFPNEILARRCMCALHQRVLNGRLLCVRFARYGGLRDEEEDPNERTTGQKVVNLSENELAFLKRKRSLSIEKKCIKVDERIKHWCPSSDLHTQQCGEFGKMKVPEKDIIAKTVRKSSLDLGFRRVVRKSEGFLFPV
ncbi:hypothetical protein ACOME3_001299 [Neoechinorhynchus agilis]